MQTTASGFGKGRVRYGVLAMLFIATAVSYADRATLSIAGAAIQKELHVDAATLASVQVAPETPAEADDAALPKDSSGESHPVEAGADSPERGTPS